MCEKGLLLCAPTKRHGEGQHVDMAVILQLHAKCRRDGALGLFLGPAPILSGQRFRSPDPLSPTSTGFLLQPSAKLQSRVNLAAASLAASLDDSLTVSLGYMALTCCRLPDTC